MIKNRTIIVCFLLMALCFISCEDALEAPLTTPPAAPSGVTLTPASFCSILVTWQDNSDNETGFTLQRSANDAFTSTVDIAVGANITSYIDRTGLTETTTYYYRVIAINSVGNSAASAIMNATTPLEPEPVVGSRIADHTIINRVRLGTLPVAAIQTAKTNLHIAYGHTSHGSQLADGMSGLVDFANNTGCAGAYADHQNLFSWNRGGTDGALDLREGDGYGTGDMDHDAGYFTADWATNGNQQNWYMDTRQYLDNPANADINVVIWSWCGQAAWYGEQTIIDNYLNPMAQLELDYPDVTFVYMTCHLNGTGTDGNLHQRNEQIRAFCAANNCWLFDFADIESWDPDATVNYRVLFGTDGCVYDHDGDGVAEHSSETTPADGDRNWALDWQTEHVLDTDWYNCGAAHSMALNANMKAYAAWWLWARLAGWDGT